MTDEIAWAFAHPEVRAAATAGVVQADRISLRDHIVSVEIGAFQTERGLRQRLRFDIVVEVTGAAAAAGDDVDRILSYDRLTEAVAGALAAERLNLLETLAERVAALILRSPQAMRVFVRVEKLDRGPGALGVEIVRARTAGADTGAAEAATDGAVRPQVAFLPNGVMSDARLAPALDKMVAEGRPVILCLGPPDTPALHAADPRAQRRIDLLAIEQNAWRLAALDRRCIVTATRTELDWAMTHGQVSVWAPSKIVLDSVGHAPPAEPFALAVWFAGQMGATELVLVGMASEVAAQGFGDDGLALPVRCLDLAEVDG